MSDSCTSSGSGSSSSSSSSGSSSGGGGGGGDPDGAMYGEGPYHNIRRGIELRSISDDFQGLFALEDFPAGTVLWKNRADGPAERSYHKLHGRDLRALTPEQLKYFIRYSYQNDDEFFITPLCAEEVDLDFSNYWNHSCDPNTLPLDEDHWVARRDIAAGEQLTIEYCTFDAGIYLPPPPPPSSTGPKALLPSPGALPAPYMNDRYIYFVCIERCLCGTAECRQFVRGDDYRIAELQARYAGHFLPFIQKKMDEERALMAQGVPLAVGVPIHADDLVLAGTPDERTLADWSVRSVRAFHSSTALDVAAHNARALATLLARFERDDAIVRAASDSAVDASTVSTSSSGSSSSSSSEGSSSEAEDEEPEAEAAATAAARGAPLKSFTADAPFARGEVAEAATRVPV